MIKLQISATVKKICIGLLALLVFFLLSEFFFRMFRGKKFYLKMITPVEERTTDSLFEPNSSFTITLEEDGVSAPANINNFGFRGKDITLAKDPHKLRIMAVGDSFVFGVASHDNETIPYLMEDRLKKSGYNVEVINAGQGHTSPLRHYLRLKKIFINFRPDLVLLFIDFTDLSDDWRLERHAVRNRDGEIIRIDDTFIDGRRSWWRFFVKRSEFLKWINNKMVRTFAKIRVLGFGNYIKAKIQGKKAKAAIANLKEELDTVEYDAILLIRGREKITQIKKHWKRTAKYLFSFFDILKQNNIPYILVTYPYGVHVGPYQWSEGRTQWGFDKGKVYDDYYIFDFIEDFANRNSIPYINTLDDFLAHKDQKLFFDYDGHITPKGNQVLADSIVRNETFKRIIESLTQEGEL